MHHHDCGQLGTAARHTRTIATPLQLCGLPPLSKTTCFLHLLSVRGQVHRISGNLWSISRQARSCRHCGKHLQPRHTVATKFVKGLTGPARPSSFMTDMNLMCGCLSPAPSAGPPAVANVNPCSLSWVSARLGAAACPGRRARRLVCIGRASGRPHSAMILQAVPMEDPDDADGEQPSDGSKPKARRLAVPMADDFGWRLAAVLLCCCLGAAGVVASLAVLSRFSEEAGGPELPMLVVFSVASQDQLETMATNNALAWVAAALLKGHPWEWTRAGPSSVFAPAISADGAWLLPGVRAWRPPSDASPAVSSAMVHGAVAGILRQREGLTPPALNVLEAAGEADAWLQLRSQLEAVDLRQKPLLLLSHPHRLPFLSVLALSSGLHPLALDPGMLSAVPWETFGCGSLGYAASVPPVQRVALEEARLAAFTEDMRRSDPERFESMLPAIRAANATIAVHHCIAAQMELGSEAAEAARSCSKAVPPGAKRPAGEAR